MFCSRRSFDAAAHVFEAAARRAAFSRRQALEKQRECALNGRSCSRAIRASSKRSARRACGRRASIRTPPHVVFRSERADMRDGHDPRLRAVDEGNRATDVAERP